MEPQLVHKALRRAQVLSVVVMLGAGLAVALGLFMTLTGEPPEPTGDEMLMRLVFLGLALLEFVAAWVVRYFLVAPLKKDPHRETSPQGDGSQQPALKLKGYHPAVLILKAATKGYPWQLTSLTMVALVSVALFQVPVLLGFVLQVSNGYWWEVLPFLAIAVAGWIWVFPRRSYWERLLQLDPAANIISPG